MFITGDELFTGGTDTSDKFITGVNPRHEFSVITGVVDFGDKFLTGVSPVTTTLPINFSPVLLTPMINFRVFGYFWLVSTTPGKNVIASVNDTADKLFSGVNDTPDKLFTGVNDITDKFFIGVPLTELSAN